ncbi:uncharacterized protein VTP21DRAFT_4463 [Calcarisporiella thermophila]|uniref:uncharacterized protein n=1 Tax=Calcarisporiella thermophila TaxID=911321 RepID=UPI0037429413
MEDGRHAHVICAHSAVMSGFRAGALSSATRWKAHARVPFGGRARRWLWVMHGSGKFVPPCAPLPNGGLDDTLQALVYQGAGPNVTASGSERCPWLRGVASPRRRVRACGFDGEEESKAVEKSEGARRRGVSPPLAPLAPAGAAFRAFTQAAPCSSSSLCSKC